MKERRDEGKKRQTEEELKGGIYEGEKRRTYDARKRGRGKEMKKIKKMKR